MKRVHLKVISLNVSDKKGVIKTPVDRIELNKDGIINDAHAGDWNRQVSILGTESFDRFSQMANRSIKYGEFAENITTEGFDLREVVVSGRMKTRSVELEITQIGKTCHGDTCSIFKEVGDCVMPKEGIFCRVITPGEISIGDVLTYTHSSKV